MTPTKNYEVAWIDNADPRRKRRYRGFDTLFEATSFATDLLSGASSVSSVTLWRANG